MNDMWTSTILRAHAEQSHRRLMMHLKCWLALVIVALLMAIAVVCWPR